jgi:hypothetical protein
VAIAPDGVTWYETQERAARAFRAALEGGGAVWLIDPHNTITMAEAICEKCRTLGYPPGECHVRASGGL